MSSIIKNGKDSEGSEVKPLKFRQGFALNSIAMPLEVNLDQSKANDQISALATENAKLKSDIQKLKIAAEQDIEAAKQDGKNEAEERIKQSYLDANKALGDGIERALSKLEDRFSSLDGLALLIAQTALEKVFQPSDDYIELISRMIARHLEGLRRETIMDVRVSEQDFESDEALAALAVRLDLQEVNIKTSQKLRGGDCVIDLRLGHLELSINDHWNDLQVLFKSMVLEGEDS